MILGEQANTIYKGLNDLIVVQTKYGQVGMIKFDIQKNGYLVRKTVNVFPD
jgi:hypothetical protein